MSIAILVSGWVLLVLWILAVTPSLVGFLTRSLNSVAAGAPEPTPWPKVSVIIPARDEAEQIESAMRSTLAIDYPNLELIAVNDRSQDATGAILDRLASEDSRLRVVHVTALPDGWLGKSHAMHVAAGRATGDYLVFTDADVFFAPDVLRKSVKMCEAGRIGHLVLMPLLIADGFFEKSLQTFFALMMFAVTQPWLVRTSFRMSYVGVGAFNMVRRTAYDACGGHAAIRLDVLDDVKLGKLMKHNRQRQDVVHANGAVRVRWQESFWGVVRGLEKNGFAVFDYSLAKLTVGTSLAVVACLFPYAAVVAWPDARGLGYLCTILFLHLAAMVPARLFGFGLAASAGLPVAVVTMIFTMWRSAYFTLLRRGVRWRDTFYPLSVLREHVY